MPSEELRSLIEALRQEVEGDVLADDVSLGLYATDASIYQITPHVVVVPRHRQDVETAVRLAVERRVPILSRGGGTSLAGQTVGAALVLDFSKWMNRLLEVDVEERWARVEPGLVRDELNDLLAVHGLHFAPDPATTSRATVGGMIGNNSSGTRSIRYGKTIDHVLEISVLLANGSVVGLGKRSSEEYMQMKTEEFLATKTVVSVAREGKILFGLLDMVEKNRDLIAARFPKTMRRVGGYPLDEILDPDSWNPAKILVGSEGTLGVILEAKVRLEPVPAHTALCVAHFTEMMDAIRAVEPILAFEPSAVEILDGTINRLARKNLSASKLATFLHGDPEAVLLIELYADSADELREKLAALAADLDERGQSYAHPTFLEPRDQQNIWEVRKSGLGLMLGMKGERKPIAFIEDAAVPVPVLPEYVEKVLGICRELDTELALYAHASVGVIHLRPILDLKRGDDVEKLVEISERSFELVREYGGSWSSEHGDGLVRSAYLPRFFGEEVYDLFRQVKALFDPENLMNPGKIVDGPAIDQDLRFGTAYKVPPVESVYRYRQDESFEAAVEMCSGVGACRKTLVGTMCPSYIATRDEEHSTRGRANALRLAMSGQLGAEGLASRRVLETLDLCLGCKACKSECPSNVDVAKLKGEVLQIHYDQHGASRRDRLIADSADLARRYAGRWWTPLARTLANLGPLRRVLLSRRGLAPERPLPPLAGKVFHRTWQRGTGDGRRVVLFADTYLDCHEPEIGHAAAALLRGCGFEVEVYSNGCCQRSRISHGFLREAREAGERTLRDLDRYFQEGVPVVVCEPSCASALTDDLPDLIDDEDLARRAAEGTRMIDVFLAAELDAGRLEATFTSPYERLLIHGHCHQKTLYGTAAMQRLYGEVEALDFSEVDSGCCGMAGSFGYEKEHYELSRKVGEDRLFPAVRELASAAAVVACGTSCRQQIEHFTGRRAVHWVETLRAARS